jgi:16S rRNA (cytosine967-C5)-methyltransferase
MRSRTCFERVYAYLRQPSLVAFVLELLWPNFVQFSPTEIDLLRLGITRVLEGENGTEVAPSLFFVADAASQLKNLPDIVKQVQRMPQKERLGIETSLPPFVVERLLVELGDETSAAASALNRRAPLTVRVNTLKGTREQLQPLLEAEGVTVTPTALSPFGLQLETRTNAHALKAFKAGWFEIQDEGSQLLGMLVDAPPRKVLDACAGAGGKTLQLAAQMGNRGELFALDVDARRLGELKLRARRAGAFNVRIATIDDSDQAVASLTGQFERVFIDAPCSGSGTLRRKPDARNRLSEAMLDEHAALQLQLLKRFAPLVKPGGRLVYGTCSILRQENESVVEQFLGTHNEFSHLDASQWLPLESAERCVVNKNLRLFPHRHNTDGFFGAVFQRQKT